MMVKAPDDLRGWATKADGTHVALSSDECAAIWQSIDASKAKRAADMPDEQAALRTMMSAFERLKELGWAEAVYCPKDGSSFDVIEPGSTGIHRCHYQGEWPDGSWWIAADGDLWPSRPILYRLDPAAEEARRERMRAAIVRFAAEDAADA